MRVLQLISRFQRRGAEVFALDLCRQLDRRGCPSRLLALYGEPGEAPELAARPGDVGLGGREGSLFERLPGWHPRLVSALARQVDAFAPDIIQVNGSRTVKYGSLLRRLRPRARWALVYRSIGTPRDWGGGRLRRAIYRRLVVARCDGIVAVSRRTMEDVEAVYRPRVPRQVIPNAVDPARFVPLVDRDQLRERLGARPETPVLVFVGSLTAEKRIDRLLRVAAESARRLLAEGALPPHLWIVGGGPLRDDLKAAPVELPIAVRFLGPQEDVASHLAAADLMLLTSDTEGTPGVVLEAACLGVPSVVTDVGGVAECVLDGVTGLLAPPADEDGLAAAAARLLSDDAERARMGAAARERALEGFTVERIAERYLTFYRSVLATRGAAPS